ncbi:MAG: polymerase alpha subunit [Herbinix sp.]|jgi:DNA polymerase-3 subunit alpha|nr:polymerase alpha subunit [Herbinix sp.]
MQEEKDRDKFTHLHVHTQGSLADSMLKEIELAKAIKAKGMHAVAITDHGNMFNVIKFYKACKREGIKPIIGMEAYVAPRSNLLKQHKIDDANYHLVLLAENNDGYQNLMSIASDSSINGMYYRPRTDKSKLREWSKGIIALSACLGGEVQQYILEKDYNTAKKVALEYQDIFGVGNFFLELQDHGLPEQKMVNEALLKMSKETNIPLVCTNDCHYLTNGDYEPHDVLMAIQAKTTVDSEKRKKYGSDQFYVKTQEEMEQLFSYIPEALENTVKIAERCNVVIDFHSNKLPPFRLPANFTGTNFEYLMMLTYKGLKKFYGEITPEIKEKAEYEANVVNGMGYVNYFLIVWDFFRFCIEGTDEPGQPSPPGWIPILTGPGRGSGAGSILLYALEITKIDPIRYDLLFERFLDPSRVSMPDVDSDFEYERRQEVIDYVIRKYGRQSVCQIITYGTLAARAAIRAVGKALDLPYSIYDETAKMIPIEPGITIKDALEQNPDLFRKYDNDEIIHRLLNISMRLEGLPTYTSTHAAGVLITDDRGVTAHVPVWANEGAIVSQYDMNILEELGLLKMDFLGLRTLGVIREAMDMIKKNHGVTVDLDQVYQCLDMAPLRLLEEGKTDGIFQLEGGGLTEFVRELKPKSMEEWIAVISLYRPGPMDSIPQYMANRRNPDLIQYPFEVLREVLGETFGVLCYQEQCMKSVIIVSGYDKSDSDGFRKVISKKKKDLIPLHRKWFIDGRNQVDLDEYGKQKDYGHVIPGGITKGQAREALERFFDKMEDFGKYAFNKSHAAAYAVVGYVTAWLKFYYPVEFMAALMNSLAGATKQTKTARYINHCRNSLGIDIVAPDINTSEERFVATEDGKIIFTLNAKNVSATSLQIIKAQRATSKFRDFDDFIRRTLDGVGKQDITAFASIGAFDSLGSISSQITAGAADIADKMSKTKQARARARNSGRAFEIEKWLTLDVAIPYGIKEFPNRVRWALEKEYLGLYLTGHPIYDYLYYSEQYSNFKLSELDYEIDEETGLVIMSTPIHGRKTVRFVGMFSSIKKTITRKNKEKMAIAEVEDLTGTAKMMIWPNNYLAVEDLLSTDKVYDFTGYIKTDPEEPPVIVLTSLEPLEIPKIKKLVIRENDRFKLKSVVDSIRYNRLFRGDTPVYVECGNIRLLLDNKCWVNLDTIDLSECEYQIIDK